MNNTEFVKTYSIKASFPKTSGYEEYNRIREDLAKVILISNLGLTFKAMHNVFETLKNKSYASFVIDKDTGSYARIDEDGLSAIPPNKNYIVIRRDRDTMSKEQQYQYCSLEHLMINLEIKHNLDIDKLKDCQIAMHKNEAYRTIVYKHHFEIKQEGDN